MSTSDRIRSAIDATREHLPAGYFRDLCRSRCALSGAAQGSFYDGVTPEALGAILGALAWAPYEHPSILPGCSAFRAELPGRLGVVPLSSLNPATPVVLTDAKRTGYVEALVASDVERPAVGFTVLILGDEGGREVVWTFHPGEPVRPSSVPDAGATLSGTRVTAAGALALGLEIAKLSD